MSPAIQSILSDLRPIRQPARLLSAGAVLWMFSALVHLAALALDSWAWSGPVSFRKPLVFSLSIGLLLATVGWVLDRLPNRSRIAGTLAWTFLISSSVEVGLITIQAWRGRASHFNVFQPGDAMIFALMGISVAVMSVCLVVVLVWATVRRPADPLVRLATIGGLVLVATGLGLGQWIIALGSEFVALNQQVPETVTSGANGVAKFPHAIAFHGIQLFVVSAIALNHGGLGENTRLRLMRVVFWSYAAMLFFASAQTVAGMAPLDMSPWSVGLGAALIGVGYGLVHTLSGLRAPARDDEVVGVAVR